MSTGAAKRKRKPATQETRDKMSKTRKGRKVPWFAKPVICVEDGSVSESASSLAIALGMPKATVTRHLRLSQAIRGKTYRYIGGILSWETWGKNPENDPE